MVTASAVVADIIDCIRNLERHHEYTWSEGDDDFVADRIQNEGQYLIRTQNPQKLESELPILNSVSIKDGETGLVTDKIKEGELLKYADDYIKYIKLC